MCFLIYNNIHPRYYESYKKCDVTTNEIKDFILENYYKRIGFSKKKQLLFNQTLENKKDLLLLANKLNQNIPDPCNAKEHYQSFPVKKNRKQVKQLEIITDQSKAFDIIDIKSVITEHPKTLHKSSHKL